MANIPKKIIVSDDYENYRLDRFLEKNFFLPKSLIQKDLRKNRIKVNKKKVKFDYRLIIGDEIVLYKNYDINISKEKKIINKKSISKFENSIILKNINYLIINKWNGIASQGGSKISISIDDILKEYSKNDTKLRLVHRLDKETSGLMVLAANIKSSRYFHELFSSRKVKKIYFAIVENKPPKKNGYFKDPILEKGIALEAETKYEIIKNLGNNLYLLKLYLKSGRKHQIRIHCSINGCPILADSKYNKNYIDKDKSKNLFLHAGEIEFTDQLGKKINLKAELPQHFRKYIKIDN